MMLLPVVLVEERQKSHRGIPHSSGEGSIPDRMTRGHPADR